MIGGLAEVLLAPGHLADNLTDRLRIGIDQPLGPPDRLQQRPKALDHRPLAGGGVGERGLLQVASGMVDFLVHPAGGQEPQAARGFGAHQPAPGAHLLEHFLEAQVEGLDVALVFHGGKGQRLAACLGLLGERFGGVQAVGLQLDQPFYLGDHLGDPQAAQEVLPLDEQPDEDPAALLSGRDEGLLPLLGRGRADPAEQCDDLRHLGLDELVDVIAHGADLAVQLVRLQAVLLQLDKLKVQQPGDQLPGHLADAILGFLLLEERFRGERLRRQRGRDQPAEQHADRPEA